MIYQLLALAGLTILIYMTVFFIIALIIKNNSIVDIGWGFGFVAVTLILTAYTWPASSRDIIVLLVILLWGIRLSVFIYLRNRGKEEDFRYAAWRKQWGKNAAWMAFFKVFMLQGIVMWIVLLPVIINFSGSAKNIGITETAGLIIFLAGFLTETISDYQLARFKNDPENKGKIITTGLWRYSRHPNYFGEALLWWGIFIITVNTGFGWAGILSPVIMSLLLRFGSGVPMLEEKYRKREDFISYAEKTPVFIPFIGRKGLSGHKRDK